MSQKEIAIKIGGEAGFGIKAAGLILSQTLFELGFFVYGYSEYPSLIRGGHNNYQINVAKNEINSATRRIDILIALNEETVLLYKDDLNEGGFIIYDGLKLQAQDFKEINLIEIPLRELSKKAGGEIVRNIIALAGALALTGLKLDYFTAQMEKFFAGKGEEIIKTNIKAAKFGYEYVTKNYKKVKTKFEIKENDIAKRTRVDKLMTANEATALGMIQAGCKFYAAYPMTPATSIMHTLAVEQRKHNIVVHQTEDEISAIGAALGASMVGVRAATGTSGGGFSLMTESVGLSGITETPIVIIESQRTSPASGLPTWTEQGDLKFIINASHGEFPRFVLAPGDAKEAFYMIEEAFNLSEKWQVPVIFVLDKLLSESDYSAERIDIGRIKITREGFLTNKELDKIKDYKRYEITKSGISKRALPGQPGGVHIINSDDHDERGFSIEDAKIRRQMMDKRFNKVSMIQDDLLEPKIYGPKKADLTLVGWGSVKGAIVDALQEINKNAEEDDLAVNFLHINYVWPFPIQRVKAILKEAKNILLIENNKTGQLGDLIAEQVGIKITNKFLKYDGRPFFREEIIHKMKEFKK